MMQYDKKQLAVPAACKEITVTLHHVGKQPTRGDGSRLGAGEDARTSPRVAQAGLAAGLANNYVQPGDKRVLAHTKVIGGGDTTSVTFPASILKKGGDYSYLCTFPGHSALMHGKFIFG